MRRLGVVAAAISIAAAPLRGQSIESRVNAVRDGMVELVFPSRPDVCGDGRGSISIVRSGDDWRGTCIHGPVRVSFRREDGRTVSVRSCVACTSRDAGATIVNADAGEAARYLLGIARTLDGPSADRVVSGAAMADAGDLSPQLLGLLRDEDASVQTRRQALFWLGQGDYPTRDLVALDGELRESGLRDQYVFVLSQRHDDAAVDKLIDLARADPSIGTRKKAMFWLGQSGDPKAIRFFKDVLTR